MMVFKRKVYDEMLDWKQHRAGRYALIIKGARRVGKTTLVRQFVAQEYESHVFIDFNSCTQRVRDLWNDISDLDNLFMRLQMECNVALTRRKSAVVFDEVQACPKARQAIKYLVEDGRYDYIETGSLISIHQNVKGITIPSEEETIEMLPLDYEEFRWAIGDKVTFPLLREQFGNRKGWGDAVNRSMMKDLRLYMLVGGMPQAVSTYIETHNMQAVDRTKRGIISLYEEDFHRIDPTGAISSLYHSIPAMLTGNNNRYMLGAATDGGRLSRLMPAVLELEDSKTVYMSWHANDPQAGLALHRADNRFKMYAADTGLFVTLAFWDKKFTENVIYDKLLFDKLRADLGYVYENLVAQMLRAAGHSLYYYTFPTEKGGHNYEVDFLISKGYKVSPIEVKSSSYMRHTSLDRFCDKFAQHIHERFLVYTKDYRREGAVQCLPAYLVPFL